jgi:mannose/fructose/N-acetylgalactosamine-specific phosphotransferase system component IID
MRNLSELDSATGMKVIGALVTEMKKISNNDELKDRLISIFKGDKSTVAKIADVADLLINDCDDIALNIVAIVNERTIKEVKKQKFLQTVEEFMYILNDEGMVSFLSQQFNVTQSASSDTSRK